MYLYTNAYKCACAYQGFVNRIRHSVLDPLKRLRRELIPNDAIMKAMVLDNVGGKRVVYRYNYFDMLYHLFLMWFVFGKYGWTEVYRKEMFKYMIQVPSKDDDDIMYVELANGREYMTRECVFDSRSLDGFQNPEKRYLCVMLSGHNISRFYKRFADSWNALGLRVIDIALLGIRLDTGIRTFLNNIDFAMGRTTLTLVDDDTFEERIFMSGDVVRF